jgi:hypothetical protein
MDKKMMEIKRKALMDLKSALKEDDAKELGPKLGLKKKVVVAADSEKGLEEGLDKAKEIMKKRMGDKMPMMDDAEMLADSDEEMEEEGECECCKDGSCPNCLKDKISKLESKLG